MEVEVLRGSRASGSNAKAYGQRLLEVLSVQVDGGGSPMGTVAVFDGKRGQHIYSHNGEPAPSCSSPCLFQNELLLTGPYRAVSADGCIAFVLNLPDEKANKSEILVDLYDPTTKYDKPISSEVETGYGRAEVKYAVLSNAVECDVQVKLLLEDDSVRTYAHGTILARSELLQHDIVLFSGEITRAIIPLARSVLAVPLMRLLEIKVDLRGPSGEQIVKESVKFNPVTDDQLVLSNGTVEVTIVWSYEEDY